MEDVLVGPKYTPEQIKNDTNLRQRSIYAEIGNPEDHTMTIRFDPIGDSIIWEIGNPYIPKSLLPQTVPNKILIKVEWL
jgi:hypothetical protein